MKKTMNTSKQLWFTLTFVILLCITVGCYTAQSTFESAPAKVEGHYTYQHAFEYDLDGNHFKVDEIGTMDFYPDGTALDSAWQAYSVTFKEGGEATWMFKYVSPSKWRLEGEDFYFAGIKERFRMYMVEGLYTAGFKKQSKKLSDKVISVVGGSIDYEYKFHLDTLTTDKLQWSFTYSDGHTDTWEFYRINSNPEKDK